jgi:hypothetical protein
MFMMMGTNDGVGQAARFGGIAGITSDDTYVYVTSDHAVRRVTIADATVQTWIGSAGQMGYMEGNGNGARFTSPAGITTDGTTIWVADAGNAVVRAIDIASGDTSLLAGSPGQIGNGDGTGTNARFDSMRDLAFGDGFVWHVQGNGVLRRIDPQTGQVVTVAGLAGTNGFVNGQGNAVRFDVPRHVEWISANLLYVSDTENNRPRMVAMNGAIGTVSSPYGGAAGYADGNGVAALFERQRGLAYAGADVLTVADSDNFVIREIDLASMDVTTIAGMAGMAAHTVGIGLAAAFDKPLDMHYDAGTGDLFISEGTVLRRMYYQ